MDAAPSPSTSPRVWPTWAFIAILALPFLITILFTKGLSSDFSFTMTHDEQKHHYPVVQDFARDWPKMDLIHYSGAMGPGFHVVTATLAQVLGTEIATIRLITTTFSFLAAIALFFLLRDRFKIDPKLSVLLTLAFVMSPYFFGASFAVCTDNFAYAALFTSLYFGLRFMEREAGPDLIWAGLFAMIASVTRQLYVVLFLIYGIMLLRSKLNTGQKAIYSAILAAFAVPLAMLVVAWGGYIPPAFQQSYTQGAGLYGRSLPLALALAAIYTFFLAPTVLAKVWEWMLARPAEMAISAAAGGAMLAAFPLYAVKDRIDGYVVEFGKAPPSLVHSSWMIWLLIPIGAWCVVYAFRHFARFWPILALVALVAAALIPSKFLYQRYLDPIVMLVPFVGLAIVPDRNRWSWILPALLVFGFALFPFVRNAMAG